MTINKKIPFIAAASVTFVLIFNSCKNGSRVCDYYYYNFKAKVTEITPYQKDGKTLYHVGLKFDNSSLSDKQQQLEELKNIEIDSAFIQRNRLKNGLIYEGTVSELSEGNCEPMYLSFDFNFK